MAGLSRLGLALLAVVAACTPLPAPVTTADQAQLGRVEAYLNALPRFEAHFVQTGDYGPGAGLVWLDRPGHLRVDFEGPAAPVLVIADGRLRLLDRATGAITTQPVSRTPLGLLLAPQITLSGAVTVTSLARLPGGDIRLVLTRTNAPTQGTLTLDFAPIPLTLVAVSVTDAARRTRTLTLSDIDRAPVITPALFQPPAR